MDNTDTDATTLDTSRLIALLLRTAEHDQRGIAAIRLLASHGRWLANADFVATAVRYWPADADLPDAAAIDWDTDPDAFPCSSSERAILAIALSLGGRDHAVNLHTAVTGLDPRHQDLVCTAVAEAMGVHRRGRRPR